MLLKLSKHLKEEDLCNLAVFGLKMDQDIVDVAIADNPKDINSAMRRVLRKWRNSQEDAEIAFNILCQALRKAELASFIMHLSET